MSTHPHAELEDLFAEARSPHILVGGQEIWSLVRVDVETGSLLRVSIESATDSPVQGLRLGIDHGFLRIAGQDLKEVVLWDDTLNGSAQAQIVGDAGTVRLNIWNVWRTISRYGDQDVEGIGAWSRNSGMLVEQGPTSVCIRCSDGRGEADFADMVAVLEWSRPTTPADAP